ncbi:chaperone Clpb, putative [Entamoeba invadens IP1]|uniref:Chaperone Clpb, putative n=1 Tax=Entamoeba invadens IP1 TaxID=370355 RepID=L7FN54_ENTIV|nr:chaperone Clpb, putative [Entamoeba invadens IP1]ELP92358.1 chaperone Clpb, putative [Entamoeba invadens IP1]|eukprot:XP_004259129.1 chaperone Clpb, putative [Entamoeba invadens IP1]
MLYKPNTISIIYKNTFFTSFTFATLNIFWLDSFNSMIFNSLSLIDCCVFFTFLCFSNLSAFIQTHFIQILQNIQNLSRWTNNNPVLIIEPGVGKTAIWKGLLQPKVKKYKLIELEMGALIIVAQYRGQFERRLKTVLKEVKANCIQVISLFPFFSRLFIRLFCSFYSYKVNKTSYNSLSAAYLANRLL